MSQVDLVRTCDLEEGMEVAGTDNCIRTVFLTLNWTRLGFNTHDRLDIYFRDGTVIRNSHALTLWRLK